MPGISKFSSQVVLNWPMLSRLDRDMRAVLPNKDGYHCILQGMSIMSSAHSLLRYMMLYVVTAVQCTHSSSWSLWLTFACACVVWNVWGAMWIRSTRSCHYFWEWNLGKRSQRFNLEHTLLVPAFGWAIIVMIHGDKCQDKPRPSVVHRRKCEGDSCTGVGKAALESAWPLRQLCKSQFFGLTWCS